MAIFRALASQRAREALDREATRMEQDREARTRDREDHDFYASIQTAHVFQSDASEPGLGQSSAWREQLVSVCCVGIVATATLPVSPILASLKLHLRCPRPANPQISRFRREEHAVLFNADLLSTGVDIPCCDCTYLCMPSMASRGLIEVGLSWAFCCIAGPPFFADVCVASCCCRTPTLSCSAGAGRCAQ